MKPTKPIIIIDFTYGFGPRFGITEATFTDKVVVTFQGNNQTSRHLRKTQTFAIATPELAKEAQEINEAMDKLRDRARALRDKLKKAAP